MPNLYRISEDILQLDIFLNDENMPEDLKKQAEEVKKTLIQQIDKKAVNIVHYMQRLTHDAALVDAEISRLKDLKDSTVKKKQRLEKFLIEALEMTGVKVDEPTIKIKLKKLPDIVVLDDESTIPRDFFKHPIPKPSLDKKALKEALKKGEVKGCHLETGRKGLNIK